MDDLEGGGNRHAHWVLGTAQLGQAYGAANLRGCPSEGEAVDLVQRALGAGLRHIDTARAYGDAERRVGLALAGSSVPNVEITTKLSPLADIAPDASAETAVAAAKESLENSSRALGRERLDAVLLHRAAHLTAWGGAVWRWLRERQKSGLIGRLGASIQTPREAALVLAEPEIIQIQIPFNVLDSRWDEAGIVEAVRHRRDVVVHARSVLLQGLLAGNPEARWPSIPGVDRGTLMDGLRANAVRLGRVSLADLCLAFVRAQDWIDGIVIGIETRDQLETNVALLERPPLTAEQAKIIRASTPRVPEALVNPARWSEFAAAGL